MVCAQVNLGKLEVSHYNLTRAWRTLVSCAELELLCSAGAPRSSDKEQSLKLLMASEINSVNVIQA